MFSGRAPNVAPNIAPQQTIPKENPKQINQAKPKKGKRTVTSKPILGFDTTIIRQDNTTYSPANAGGTYKAGGG